MTSLRGTGRTHRMLQEVASAAIAGRDCFVVVHAMSFAAEVSRRLVDIIHAHEPKAIIKRAKNRIVLKNGAQVRVTSKREDIRGRDRRDIYIDHVYYGPGAV